MKNIVNSNFLVLKKFSFEIFNFKKILPDSYNNKECNFVETIQDNSSIAVGD